MIKQIQLASGNTKTGYQFGTIEILSPLISPIQNKICIEEEVQYFKNNFDNLKIIEVKKQKGFKHADVVPIYLWSSFFCVSKKFKDLFEGKLKGYWYPTNSEDYFIFLLDNCIDALNKSETIIYYPNTTYKPYQYKYMKNITFKEKIDKEEYLFTVIELYSTYCSTEKMQKLIKDNGITGFKQYVNFNVRNENGNMFDMLRNKKYDEEGNCLE